MHLLERPIQRLAGSKLARAATWPHGVDGYAGLVAPTWSVDRVRARIVGLHRQTADTVTVTLRPNANWHGHRAGQHVLLTIEVAGVRQTRCFSVASAEHTDDLELTCKAGPASVVSRHLRDAAEVGAIVELSQAQGDFTLPSEFGPVGAGPLVLVSAGSGITPVLSMLRTLDADGHDGPVTFLHYARSAADVLYGDELRAIEARRPNVRVVVITEDGNRGGRFEPGHLPTAAEHAFVCGPAPFMDLVESAWRDAGGDPAAFHTERFGPPATTATTATGCRLRFARSGVEVVDDGRPILEQAEAAGLRPAHGCRMGICHTCVVPDADGTPVRICVTAPAGDLTLDL